MTTQLHLLLAGVLAGIATYCGTQPNHKNVKDKIMQIRTEVKEIEVKEQEKAQKSEPHELELCEEDSRGDVSKEISFYSPRLAH